MDWVLNVKLKVEIGMIIAVLRQVFYMGNNSSNAPNAGWVYVIHLVHNELYAKQIALYFLNTDIWIRQKHNGEWSEWLKLH